MEAFALALRFSSATALMVGVFLIFNAFSVSVTQRRTQIGIMRALGVTRGQVRALFLGEGLLLGVVGSVLGVAGGALLGRAMMTFMASVVQQTYGLQISAGRFRMDPPWIGASLLLGIAASVVGVFLPARSAAAVDPVLALQKGKFQIMFLGENWRRRRAGALLLAVCAALVSTPWRARREVQLAAQVMLFTGLTLLVPTFSHLLGRLLRHPMGWLFGLEGRLASDSLLQSPRRTSATVAALMFSLAFVVSSASLSASLKVSLLRWVDAAVNPDLLVAASENMTSRTFQFPDEMGEELRRMPGVRQVDSLRIITLNYETRSPILMSIEIDQYLRRARPILEQGRIADLVPAMVNGDGILVSSNLARLYGLGRGDRVALETPTGRHEFEVVGVIVDYTSDSGAFIVDRRTYRRLWNDDRVDTFELMLEKSWDPGAVRHEIRRRYADRRNVFVLTNEEFRGEVLRMTNQFWALTYVQTLMAVAVGVLGIVNSLTVSITERKREIGILRALGGGRRRVRKAIVLEAVVMGAVAVILGAAIGSTLGYYVVGTIGVSITGWTFPYTFPLGVASLLLPSAAVVCILAAWYPSSVAVRTPIVEALAYE